MAIRTITYTAHVDGIYPRTEQHGGTQNEHQATLLEFKFDGSLKDKLSTNLTDSEKLLYRFDVYDGAGGYHPSDAADLDLTPDTPVVQKLLEQYETAAGGTLQVYLVISKAPVDIAADEAFEPRFIFYTSPAYLVLDPLPNGVESERKAATDLNNLNAEVKGAIERCNNAVEIVAEEATKASNAASSASDAAERANEVARELEEAKNNGDFDGKDGASVASAEVVSGDLLIFLDNGNFINAGRVKGNTGDKGEKGEPGVKGDKGDAYLLTDTDKTDIANLVLSEFVDGDEVSY